MRCLIIFVFVVVLTGCMVGPDYVRPVVDVPAAFRYEDKEARETANTEWWKQFRDPVLDELIIEALANNRNIKIAAANVEQAAGVLIQTRSSLFPQIGYSGSGTKQRCKRVRSHTYAFFCAEPSDLVPGHFKRKLGDRPVGPHPSVL